MKIGGIQKVSLIDYPGKIAATVFLSGCNFRCPWCYNRELVLPAEIKKQPSISEKEFFKFLKEKKGLLEGAVISGGEPTLNKNLPDFIKKIKKLGYSVKLDTNGSNPDLLKSLVNRKLIDYVALDIKGPTEKYKKITGGKADIKKIEESVDFLKKSKIDCEFRTTVVPALLKKEDILKIAEWISGAKRYYLQNVRPEKNLSPKFRKIKPYPQNYLLDIHKAISPFFEVCQIR